MPYARRILDFSKLTSKKPEPLTARKWSSSIINTVDNDHKSTYCNLVIKEVYESNFNNKNIYYT